MANYNVDTFLQSYESTDTAIALVNTQGTVTALVNVCNITKILTEDKEVWIVLPDNKVTLGFSSASEAQLALTVLQQALDELVLNCALATGSGGAGETHSVTYTELSQLVQDEELVPGDYYLLTDYQCIHDIKDALGNTVSNSTLVDPPPLERLTLAATANNRLHYLAHSGTYPLDVIHYDGSDTTGGATKGRITYRKNTENGEEATYDFRNATTWRWEFAPGNGIYSSPEFISGCAYQTFKPFGNSTSGTILGYNKDLSGVFPSNNYVDADCTGVTFEEAVFNCTATQSQQSTFKKGTNNAAMVSCYDVIVGGNTNTMYLSNYCDVEGESLLHIERNNLTDKRGFVQTTFEVDATTFPGDVYEKIPQGANIFAIQFSLIDSLTIGGDPSTETIGFELDGVPMSFLTNLGPPASSWTIDDFNSIIWASAALIIPQQHLLSEQDLTIVSSTNPFLSGRIKLSLFYSFV